MDLKPCPFCGSDDVYAEIADYVQEDFVRCNSCKAQTGLYCSDDLKDSEDKAIEAWNNRSAAASKWKSTSKKPDKPLDYVVFCCFNCVCSGRWRTPLPYGACGNCPEYWAEIKLPKE